MSSRPLHLCTFERILRPGTELLWRDDCWAVLRLKRGAVYLLCEGTPKELTSECVILCPPRSSVTILASRIEEAALAGTIGLVDALSGLLTIAELQCLEFQAPLHFSPYQLLPRSHELALGMAGLEHPAEGRTVARRLCFIESFLNLVAPYMVSACPTSNVENQDAKGRLRQFCES